MVENLTLGWNNRIDENSADSPTLSGGSFETALPIGNIRTARMSQVARSTDATTANTQFLVDYGESIYNLATGLFAGNFSVDARYRFSHGDNSATLGLEAVDAIFSADTPPGEITVTRSGTATRRNSAGLIAAVSANTGRINHDKNGAYLGLMKEPGATNLLVRSSEFDNAIWAGNRSTVSANAISTLDPMGTNTADKLVETIQTGQHYANQSGLTLTNDTYVFSVWVKKSTRARVQLMAGYTNPYAGRGFDLTAGTTFTETMPGVNDALDWGMEDWGNGWWRIWIEFTGSSGSSNLVRIVLDNGVDDEYTGDGTSGLFIFGAQLEQGTGGPTSYIPTSTAAASRGTETVEYTVDNGTYDVVVYGANDGSVASTAATDEVVSGGTYELTPPSGDIEISRVTFTPADMIYDTGWRDAYEAIYPQDVLEWEDDNWWTGKPLESDLEGYKRNIIHIAEDIFTARYTKVFIEDTANTDGYVQFGYMFEGPAWQVEYNPDYGMGIGFEAQTLVDEALGGAEYFDERDPRRVAAFTLSFMDEDEAFAQAFELMRRKGISKPVLFIPKPDNDVHRFRQAFLARLTALGAVEEYAYGLHRVAVSLREII